MCGSRKLYAAEDRVDDAIEAYKKAVERNPSDGETYRQLGRLYLRKDDLDAAEKAFKEGHPIQHSVSASEY